jgi:hypothetical protein
MRWDLIGRRLAIPRGELLGPDGSVLWPGATPNDTRLAPARRAAEAAVALAVREHSTYGQASIRHVADARNELTEFARQSLAPLKARDRMAAAEL